MEIDLRNINWNLIKKDYINGEPIDILSAKYNVGISTIRKQITKDNWVKSKKEISFITYQDNIYDVFYMIMGSYLNRNIEYQVLLDDLKSKTLTLESDEKIKDTRVLLILENNLSSSFLKMIDSLKKIIELKELEKNKSNIEKEITKTKEITEEAIKQITKDIYGL